MLTGADLLARVREMGDASKSDLVRACGYVSTKQDGTARLNYTAFYEALLQAKGVEFGVTPRAGRAGRKLTFRTRVQFNGNLMVGRAYTAMLDLKPGDAFEIRLGRRQIRLVPLGAEEEDA
ncbi:MAG: AbrB family transcriptional regulator [Synechococcaceae cyanobacterium]|nr:AbrB family transcriptional regulator [Synechococcaceae cyanobacterium]